MIIHFDLSRKKSIHAVEKAMMSDQKIFLVTQSDPEEKEPVFKSVYHVGTVAIIKQVIKMPNDILRVLVDGQIPAQLYRFEEEVQEYLSAEIEFANVEDYNEEISEIEREAMLRNMK